MPDRNNGVQPRQLWLLERGHDAMIALLPGRPLQGYRRLTSTMFDADLVAASPSSVYRVLKAPALLRKGGMEPSRNGTRFVPQSKPLAHWATTLTPDP